MPVVEELEVPVLLGLGLGALRTSHLTPHLHDGPVLARPLGGGVRHQHSETVILCPDIVEHLQRQHMYERTGLFMMSQSIDKI